MARKRMVSPEFWTDDKIIELTIEERLLFIGMWNFADDEGIMTNKPKQIKAQIFPVDDITHGDISDMLMNLHTTGLIYFGNDNTLIKIKNWTRYQKINRPTPSNYSFKKGITESSVSNQETITTSIGKDSIDKNNIEEKKRSTQPKKVSSKPPIPYSARVDKFYMELLQDTEYLKQLKEAYPNVNIKEQIGASKMWLLSNTHKAKKNFKRFVNTWMSRQMEFNRSNPNHITDLDANEQRIERERKAFAKKMEEASKDVASDEDRQEALAGYLNRKNKYKDAHNDNVASSGQRLKGSIDKLLKGIANE